MRYLVIENGGADGCRARFVSLDRGMHIRSATTPKTWCSLPDLNRHARGPRVLSALRMPIPPRERMVREMGFEPTAPLRVRGLEPRASAVPPLSH